MRRACLIEQLLRFDVRVGRVMLVNATDENPLSRRAGSRRELRSPEIVRAVAYFAPVKRHNDNGPRTTGEHNAARFQGIYNRPRSACVDRRSEGRRNIGLKGREPQAGAVQTGASGSEEE